MVDRRRSPHADQRGQIWKRLKRREGFQHARFLTFSCVSRLPLFHRSVTKDRFVASLLEVSVASAVTLDAFVVMPEHVHLLIRPDPDGVGVGEFLRKLKAPFGRRVLANWREDRPEAIRRITADGGTLRFWQPGGGYDRNICSEDEYAEKYGYIHGNPVKRGLVRRVGDYRWSSAWDGGVATA